MSGDGRPGTGSPTQSPASPTPSSAQPMIMIGAEDGRSACAARASRRGAGGVLRPITKASLKVRRRADPEVITTAPHALSGPYGTRLVEIPRLRNDDDLRGPNGDDHDRLRHRARAAATAGAWPSGEPASPPTKPGISRVGRYGTTRDEPWPRCRRRVPVFITAPARGSLRRHPERVLAGARGMALGDGDLVSSCGHADRLRLARPPAQFGETQGRDVDVERAELGRNGPTPRRHRREIGAVMNQATT